MADSSNAGQSKAVIGKSHHDGQQVAALHNNSSPHADHAAALFAHHTGCKEVAAREFVESMAAVAAERLAATVRPREDAVAELAQRCQEVRRVLANAVENAVGREALEARVAGCIATLDAALARHREAR